MSKIPAGSRMFQLQTRWKSSQTVFSKQNVPFVQGMSFNALWKQLAASSLVESCMGVAPLRRYVISIFFYS